jgi:hypothetical protein
MAFSKKLPENRADYSISDLIYWHVLVYGTRPKGNPSAKVGWPWDLDSLAALLEVDERTLRNWMSGKTRCTKLRELADELFGTNTLFDEWRFELFEAYRSALLDESQGLSERPESLAGKRSSSKDRLIVPSERSDLTAIPINAPGIDKPPNEAEETPEAGLTAPENDGSNHALFGANHAVSSTFSDTEPRSPAADIEPTEIENGEPITEDIPNDSAKNAKEEAPFATTNPLVLRRDSKAGNSDRIYRYRRRIAIVGVSLTVLMGLFAWTRSPGPVPPKAPGETKHSAESKSESASTPITVSPSPATARLSDQLTKTPTGVASPPTNAPTTTTNLLTIEPAKPSEALPAAPSASATTMPVPAPNSPSPTPPEQSASLPDADAVPAADTEQTKVPAPTIVSPQKNSDHGAKPSPSAVLTEAPADTLAPPPTKGAEASIPQALATTVPPAANSQPSKQGSVRQVYRRKKWKKLLRNWGLSLQH